MVESFKIRKIKQNEDKTSLPGVCDQSACISEGVTSLGLRGSVAQFLCQRERFPENETPASHSLLFKNFISFFRIDTYADAIK